MKHKDTTLTGETPDETILDAIDSASCRGVHADRLPVLE
jgi:hypothetical protein